MARVTHAPEIDLRFGDAAGQFVDTIDVGVKIEIGILGASYN